MNRAGRLVSVLALLCLAARLSAQSGTPTISATSPVQSPAAPGFMPQSPGFHDLLFTGTLGGQPRQIGCNLFLPRQYSPDQKWPMLVYLIGVGDRGTNNGAVYNNGPAMSLRTDRQLAAWAPFILLTPQCPADLRWDSPGATELIAQSIRWATNSLPVDPDRVYLTGLSMGGAATWRVALEMPGTFAAVAPFCSIEIEPGRMAAAVADTSVYIFCGGDDRTYTAGSRRMYEALRAANTDVIYVEIPGMGHGIWPPYYGSRVFYDSLLLHRRGRKPTTRPLQDDLLAIAYSRGDSADAQLTSSLREFLPWWHISNCGREGSPGLKDELLGRKRVFVTTPLAGEVPCRLMFTTTLPTSGEPKLRMLVAAHPDGAWELIVRANSIEMLRQRVAGASWQEFTVNLAQFRGQAVHLELLNASAGLPHPQAYWGEVELK